MSNYEKDSFTPLHYVQNDNHPTKKQKPPQTCHSEA